MTLPVVSTLGQTRELIFSPRKNLPPPGSRHLQPLTWVIAPLVFRPAVSTYVATPWSLLGAMVTKRLVLPTFILPSFDTDEGEVAIATRLKPESSASSPLLLLLTRTTLRPLCESNPVKRAFIVLVLVTTTPTATVNRGLTVHRGTKNGQLRSPL